MPTAMTGRLTMEPSRQLEEKANRERELVLRFIQGDGSVFDAIVSEYQPRVTGLAYRLLGWTADVEDVVQEVFLAVYRHLGRFRGESSMKTWITTITVNKCRSWRRKQLLKLKLLQQAGEKPVAVAAADERMMDQETLGQVREALLGLPGRYREVVVLHYLESMGIAEIAEVLNLTRNAVDVRLSRARAQLKAKLADLICL